MSQRQYVGARYVPKFADPLEWSNNRTYEALTVVTHNGGSYTSKKPVPVGINITDENYWVLTFNYNAQFEAYRQMVESEIDVKKKRILVIGDSYNDQGRAQYATNGVTVWGVQAMNILGVENYTNIGISGAGWIHANSDGKKFIDALIEASPSGNYTDIIVGGGLNDVIHYTTPQNPMNAIAEFITLAKTKYPNVKIHIGVLGYTYSKYQVFEYNYVKAIRDNDLGLDFSYITNIEYAIKGRKWLLSDNLHPTQSASTRIASAVVQHMKGSVSNFVDTFSYSPSGLPPIYIITDNGVTTFKTSEFPIVSEIQLNDNGKYVGSLGEIVGYDFTGVYNNITPGFRLVCGTHFSCIGKDSGNTLYPLIGTLRLEPTATLDGNDITSVNLTLTLELRDHTTGEPARNLIVYGSSVNRFPFMSTTTDTLAF